MRALFCLAVLSLTLFSHCQEVKSCQTSAECPGSNTCEDSICVRQDLFPLNGKEVLATFISVVMNVFLNIGGVGGGAVHIPYIHLLYETTIAKAVSISFACVFGASLGYVFCTVPIKDAKTKKYLINYDISLITLPALMIGVGFGTIVSKFLSPLISGIIIVFVLVYAIMRSALKFKTILSKELMEDNQKKVYQTPDTVPLEAKSVKPIIKEKQIEPIVMAPASIQEIMSKNGEDKIDEDKNEDEDQEQSSPVKPFFKRKSLPASTIFSAATATTFDRTYSRVLSILVKDNVPLANSQQLDKERPGSANEEKLDKDNADAANQNDQQLNIQVDSILSKLGQLNAQEERFPFRKLLNLLVNILSILTFSLIRGTSHFKSIFGVQWSLSWDFIWFSVGTLCFILATIKSIYDVMKSQKEKQAAGYTFLANEPIVNRKNLIPLLIRAVIGGFVSAVSTLAGAFVVGPALVNMGMPAAFAGATTNMFMILSMFNAMLGLLLDKTLSAQEAVWFIVFACMLSVVVTKSLNFYVKRTGKESTVIGLILVGTIIGVMCLISTMMQSMISP